MRTRAYEKRPTGKKQQPLLHLCEKILRNQQHLCQHHYHHYHHHHRYHYCFYHHFLKLFKNEMEKNFAASL